MHYSSLIASAGTAKSVINVRRESLEIHSYTPTCVAATGILFLFDGLNRNAVGIRDKAISIADRNGLILVAPRMDKDRFPKWRYHHAGVICDGWLQHPHAWTGRLIREMIDLILERIEYEVSRVYLFGHSAGAQLLARICAYSPLKGVNAVIVANPSSYVLPLLDEPAPFGFKNVFSKEGVVQKLKAYLATPMTVYLGMEDTQNLYLSLSRYPMQQGKNRVERGRNLYRLGQQVAQAHGFKFNWRLVEIPGVGHSSREMLDRENFAMALSSRPDA